MGIFAHATRPGVKALANIQTTHKSLPAQVYKELVNTQTTKTASKPKLETLTYIAYYVLPGSGLIYLHRILANTQTNTKVFLRKASA